MMSDEIAPATSGAPAHRWKTYITYKDSGAEWLGEVPEHWDVKKLKYLVSSDANSFVDGPFGSDLKNEEYKDDGVPLIQLNNIIPGKHVLKNTKYISEEKAQDLSRHVILPGQIVIAKMAEPVARASCVNSVYSKYVIVADCVKFNPNDELAHIPFLVYSINSSHVRYKAELLSTGTTRLRINLGSIKNLSLLFPPIPEQRTIAAFLDRKTDHIDTLISKKERFITLFQEKRAALISHTVTKGLDPDVPMKDSGVEWLGEIPAHWIVTLLKRAFYVQLGKMLQSTQTSEEDTLEPYLRAANIFWNGVDISDVKKMWFSPYEKDHYLLRNDDLLISEGGDVGRSALWKGDIEYCYIQNAINRVRSREINSTQFLYYWIYVLKFNGYIDMLCNKATIAHFTAEKVEKIHIILPPSTEQRSIFAFLDCETAKLDDLTAKIQEAIEKLQEYRTALISAAVTGKIDVRNENRN
jgi:type I restriction enzyme S subunit